MKITQQLISDLSYKIIGSAIEVHKQLGPGLLESVYKACLVEELKMRGMKVQPGMVIPILYKGKNLGGQLRLDLLVEDIIVVEMKAVEEMIPLYQAQLLSYLKLTSKPKGLLINCHCENIVSQLVSMVTKEFELLPAE